MTKLQLTKLHATANDFLVRLALDTPSGEPGGGALAPGLPKELVARLCDRHRGVGADGLISITPGRDGADCTMVLQNADGGIAEMTGNGIRCLAWAAARAGLGTSRTLTVDTGGGRRKIALTRNGEGEVVAAEVDMGAITFGDRDVTVTVHGTDYTGDEANVGNPHFVVFVDDPAAARVTTHGPIIERNDRFPNRTNVEFVRVLDPGTIQMRVWERGTGETMSCGTGACAVAAVAHRRNLVAPNVTVLVPGGELTVALGATVRLGGPVEHVFDVDIEL